jgi:hypothetical protein
MLEFDKLVNIKPYKTTSARNMGHSGGSTTTGYRAEIEITDYTRLIRMLGQVDKMLVKELKARYKEIASPVRDKIRNAIDSQPPLSGMRKVSVPGRVAWGVGKPPKSTTIRVPRVTKTNKGWAITAVRVNSAATIIADMAGKSNRVTGKSKKTELYRYNGPGNKEGYRQHRLSRAGSRLFIANLDARLGGKASRRVWPAAEDALPEAQREMQEAINKAVTLVNRNMRSA